MEASLLVLAGTVVIFLGAAVAGAARTRAMERRAAAVRRAGLALFFARRLHALACRWSASGSTVAGLMACRFALGPLLGARNGLARTGDECLIIQIEMEIGRNTELSCVCGRVIFRAKEALILKETGLARALQGARIRLWIEEAEGLADKAAAEFGARRYRVARENYRLARPLLATAHKGARLSGRHELLPAIRAAWEACRGGMEACDACIIEGEIDPEPRLRLYVKGRINPYFRRDDGTARARPDWPGFWGASGHAINQ